LAEKGYRVAVLEKGRRFSAEDFPKSNWDLRRWMWLPALGLKGIFQMSFFRHVTILHGVGVGGGSLTYANTLPMPKDDFFESPSWAALAPWKEELAPHYVTARRMLGAAKNPVVTTGDRVLREIAEETGRGDHVHSTEVAVYFGEPGKKVADPYFDGKGPERTGCTFCGACMTGCRVGAKNTLDRNYLWLAEKLGVTIHPETEVTAVRPWSEGGYVVETRPTFGGSGERIFAKNVVFAGGVLGTVPLLLKLRSDAQALPDLSPRLGDFVRTNSEALIAVVSTDPELDFSKGVAITSIVHTDAHSHIEPVRYAAGSGFFRTMGLPHAPGPTFLARLWGTLRSLASEPLLWAKTFLVKDFARSGQVLLYMRTLEGTLSLKLGRSPFTGFRLAAVTGLDDATKAPQAFMAEATDWAKRFAAKVKGVTMTLLTETILGVPSTAHVLGGACMGASPAEGVIDARHRVFGYEGLYVVDGSAVSANPGVNPSLTITAMAERAMSFVPRKNGGADS
ncbi:MAG: GMC oxidoreductase, partial [Polyangiaceae bacterium]